MSLHSWFSLHPFNLYCCWSQLASHMNKKIVYSNNCDYPAFKKNYKGPEPAKSLINKRLMAILKFLGKFSNSKWNSSGRHTA